MNAIAINNNKDQWQTYTNSDESFDVRAVVCLALDPLNDPRPKVKIPHNEIIIMGSARMKFGSFFN